MTITVKIPTDYLTIQDAINSMHPTHAPVDILIESGHDLTHGVYLYRGDYSLFKISSVDSIVNLAASFNYVDSTYRAIMKIENAVAPVWNIIVDGNSQSGRGLMYVDQSHGKIEIGKGAINCNYFGVIDNGTNIYIHSSHVTGQEAVATGGSRGLWVTRTSTADFEGSNFDNADFIGIYASRASNVSVANSSARNAGTVGIHASKSFISAQETDVSGSSDRGYVAEEGGTIDAHDGIASECANYGVSAENGGKIYARNVDASAAGIEGFRTTAGGVVDKTGGTGTINGSVFVNWLTKSGVIIDNGGSSFSPIINLTNSVSGSLPIANGGTGCTSARESMAALKGVYILGASGVASSVTGTTSETTLATINVPANCMGANGRIEVTTTWAVTSSVNNKELFVRFGGASGPAFTDGNVTSITTLTQYTHWHNRGATNSQVGGSQSASGGFTNSAANAKTGSVDTSVSQDILIRGKLVNSAETITLESYVVKLIVP